MVTIKKGDTTLEVSNCAYKDIFKKQGYKIINEKANKKEEPKKEEPKKEEPKKEDVQEILDNKIEEQTDVVNSKELTKKIDMGVKDNLFPSKENKGKK